MASAVRVYAQVRRTVERVSSKSMKSLPKPVHGLLAAGIVCAGFAAASPAAKPTDAAKWVCAGAFMQKFDRFEASVTIRQYRERFLSVPSGAVRRAVFVFPTAHRVMRKHLRSVNNARFGEKTHKEFTAFDMTAPLNGAAPAKDGKPPAGAPLPDPVKVQAGSTGSDIRFPLAPATHIRTDGYNKVPSKDGESVLDILAIDGSGVIGGDSTLIVMSRRDSAKSWGLGESRNPFAFGRHRSGASFVTSTEFKLMQRLSKLYGVPFAVLPLQAKGPLSESGDAWRAAKDWLTSYRSAPDTVTGAKAPGRC